MSSTAAWVSTVHNLPELETVHFGHRLQRAASPLAHSRVIAVTPSRVPTIVVVGLGWNFTTTFGLDIEPPPARGSVALT
jgi:hypothetical protein